MVQAVRRGEIYLVNWNPARGSEQGGIRPALVIQNDTGNRFSPNTIVASITTAAKRHYPFTVAISRSESGLPKNSTVDLAAIMTISQTRLGARLGKLGASRMAEVDAAIRNSLEL